MYCTNCGKKLEGGEFCTNCGNKIEPSVDSQIPNISNTINSTASKTTVQHKSKKNVLAVIGGIVALVIVILVLTEGKSEDKNTVPYYSDPYTNTQGYVPPPVYYANDFTDDFDYDSYDSYDSYDYSNTSQTCTSCYGSGICPICNGTGQYSMYGNDYSECTACYGTGICSICGGDGVY